MKRLQISVLPSLRATEDPGMPTMERDGFVDEAVVLALVAGPAMTRQPADPGELALAADDMDFAGWKLSNALPSHATRAVPYPPETRERRPAPPVLEEPGLGAPHRGSHRWWLAGLAGALSALLFSLLLLSLSSREAHAPEGISIIRLPAASGAPPAPKTGSSQAAPELTGVSSSE